MRLEIEGLEHRVPVVLYTCTSHSEGSHSANVYWLKESMASPQESEVSFLAKSPHGVPSPPWDLLGGTMSSADSTGSIHASCPCHCCSCGIDSCIPQKRLPLEPMPDTVGGREVGGMDAAPGGSSWTKNDHSLSFPKVTVTLSRSFKRSEPQFAHL